MAESSTITREMIKAAAQRIVQRIEDAIPKPIFYCEADREEAVEIAQAEIATVAMTGARDMSAPSTRPGNVSMDSAYSAVFLLAQDSLKAGAPGLAADIQNAIARSIAHKLVGRKLAPAAYGDKRQPYHSGACIGIVGMSVNLRFSDNSAEFVFHEEDLELINEEGRDLYFIRFPASEILAFRQALIDYLPASETEGAGAAPDLRADREALRKALTEIMAAADKMIFSLPCHWHDDATIDLTDAAADARAVLSAATQNDLYDTSEALSPTEAQGGEQPLTEVEAFVLAHVPTDWVEAGAWSRALPNMMARESVTILRALLRKGVLESEMRRGMTWMRRKRSAILEMGGARG